jgi:hypothetical protein
MGKGHEKEIHRFKVIQAAKAEGCLFAKVRMQARDGLALKSLGSALFYLNVRMLQQ